MPAIELVNLHKRYGRHPALGGVTLQAVSGRILGFLGPNGAGKTTAIRILLGLLRATSGECRIFGMDCWREGPQLRGELGYLPGEPRFYPRMTGRSLLRFFARARGTNCDQQIARLADRFDLDLARRVREYSSGMKQKLGLIQALMHRPKLLVLDEPTNALDPLVRVTLFEELRAARDEGRTVLFSSHTLAEVEQLCDDVAILRNGLLMEQATVEALRSRAGRSVRLRFETPPEVVPEALKVTHQNNRELSGVWSSKPSGLLSWLASLSLSDVVIGPPRLEDLFMTYYERSEREESTP